MVERRRKVGAPCGGYETAAALAGDCGRLWRYGGEKRCAPFGHTVRDLTFGRREERQFEIRRENGTCLTLIKIHKVDGGLF